jgi:hypothetical protein
VPPHVLVIVLDAGMTVDAFPLARGVEMGAGELAYDDTQAQIVAELKALRAELAVQREYLNTSKLIGTSGPEMQIQHHVAHLCEADAYGMPVGSRCVTSA